MKRLAPYLGFVVLVAQLWIWLPRHVWNPIVYDVDVYQAAARHAVAHEQVYGRQQRVRVDEVPSGFYYPPTALALVKPAAYMSPIVWRSLCFGLSVISVWVLAAALAKLATGKVDICRTLTVGLLLSLFPPVNQSLNVGNLDMLVIAMVAWAFAEERLAAPLLILASAIKVYPAFALLGWAFSNQRIDRHFRIRATLTVSACIALALLVGPHYVHEWRALCVPQLSEPAAHFGNWSLSMILVYPDLVAEIANTPVHTRLILSLAPIVAAVVTAILMRKRPVTHAAVAALVAGTWFTSFCWWWRILPLLTIPAAMWWRVRFPPLPCTFCGGRGFFIEPTNFGEQPDGMQRITCPECRGR